jgi:hypothetical protein
MKKVLLIGLILAICVLAFPQGVLAADQNVEINANVNDVSELTAAWVGGTWDLYRASTDENLKSQAVHVTVDSSSQWTLSAADANSEGDSGYMISSGDGSTPLATKFKLDGQNLDIETLREGNAEPLTDYYFDVQQQVINTDDSSLTYKITVTFTLTST